MSVQPEIWTTGASNMYSCGIWFPDSEPRYMLNLLNLGFDQQKGSLSSTGKW